MVDPEGTVRVSKAKHLAVEDFGTLLRCDFASRLVESRKVTMALSELSE